MTALRTALSHRHFPLVCSSEELEYQNDTDPSLRNGTINFTACIIGRVVVPAGYFSLFIMKLLVAAAYYNISKRTDEFKSKHRTRVILPMGGQGVEKRTKNTRFYSLIFRAIWMYGHAIAFSLGFPVNATISFLGSNTQFIATSHYILGNMGLVAQLIVAFKSVNSLESVLVDVNEVTSAQKSLIKWRALLHPYFQFLGLLLFTSVHTSAVLFVAMMQMQTDWHQTYLDVFRLTMVYGAGASMLSYVLTIVRRRMDRKIAESFDGSARKSNEPGNPDNVQENNNATLSSWKERSEARKKFKVLLLTEFLYLIFGASIFTGSLVASHYSSRLLAAIFNTLNCTTVIAQAIFTYLDFWKTLRKQRKLSAKIARSERKRITSPKTTGSQPLSTEKRTLSEEGIEVNAIK